MTAINQETRMALNNHLDTLAKNKDTWAALPIYKRMHILKKIRNNFITQMDKWVAYNLEARRYDKTTELAGEEWMGASIILRQFDMLLLTLKELNKKGNPRLPAVRFKEDSKQTAIRVFPRTKQDYKYYSDLQAEILLQKHILPEQVAEYTAVHYKTNNNHPRGKLCLILGAGNHSTLVTGDILHTLFVKNQAAIFKINPVNDYLDSLLKNIFSPLIHNGYLAVVTGGRQEGAFLAEHKLIDSIHLTGSLRAYESIVFGDDNIQHNKKEITAELGNITPVIIVPGRWSDEEMLRQAGHIANMVCNNSGFNCGTARLIITHKQWHLREKFLSILKAYLHQRASNKPYYPGCREIYNEFIERHPEAIRLGKIQDDDLPWTLIPDLDMKNTDDICFRKEPFCSLFAEMPVPAGNTEEYLDKTVKFLNIHVWGSLCASLIVHPDTLKDRKIKTAFNRAVSDLRYGTIGINIWSIISFILGTTPWGGYPGNPDNNIQSGKGFVNNAFMVESIEKTVITGPFLANHLDPFLLPGYHIFAEKLAKLQAKPSLGKLLSFLKSFKQMAGNARTAMTSFFDNMNK
jgi:hypothetical protein